MIRASVPLLCVAMLVCCSILLRAEERGVLFPGSPPAPWTGAPSPASLSPPDEPRAKPEEDASADSPPAGGRAATSDAKLSEMRRAIDGLRAEMKKNAWRKGDFAVVPYGVLYFNMVYATQRTSPGSYTLFVTSATAQPESEFVIDARTTRLGIDVAGPKIASLGDAPSGGKIEIDFQNSLLSTENKATIMLRHAYAEVKNEEFRLLFGQTSDVISPLMPGMLQYAVGRDAGNIGYRRAQLRAERFWAFSEVFLATLQLSANQQVFEDGTTTIRGETPSWPIIEGRIGWTIGPRGKDDRPMVVGVSAHIGEEQADVAGIGLNQRRRTWSANIDLRIPFSERCGLQAEYFMGENLGAFLGGIGQGVEPATLLPIRSRGGWISIWHDWTPSLHFNAGYTLDDPWNQDLPTRGDKTCNQSVFGNVAYDVTDKLLVGLEVSAWKTFYRDMLPGKAVRCEFVVKYGF